MKIIALIFLLLITSCTTPKNIEEYKAEVMQTELAFVQMVGDEGIEKAFLAFAADNAVLNRNSKILKGHQAFIEYFSNPVWKDARLLWEPDFIDVSASGDLAYTYGSYTFISKDSTGETSESNGIFHTVWKRQKDGSWKFVWD